MTIDRWIETHARFSPEKPAIRFQGWTLTYAALDRAIGRTAHWLSIKHGISRGDRLAWLGYNAPDMLVLLFAAARLGAIVVPLNWRLAPPELAHAVADSGAKLLVHQPAFREMLPAIAEALRETGGEEPKTVEVDPATGGLNDLLEGAPALAAGEGLESDPLLIVYTSGTTGRPKGAVLTQRAILANALNSRHMHAMTAEDLVLTVLPMFHVGGLNIQTTPALYLGAAVILHERFHPGETLAAIAADKPTLTVLVPATMAAMIGHADWEKADISSLKAVATGSSDVPVEMMRAFIARGAPVIQIYGSTETAPIAIYQQVTDAPDELGAIGRPGLHTQARIARPDGSPAAPGEVGEIELRGDTVTAGYWGRDAGRDENFRGGWFRSGDLGLVDQNGVYWFKDRLKNVVISGGENIYPAELERILREIDWIGEAAVVGCPDPRWGEVPVAVVVTKPGHSRDEKAVLSVFDGRLARYKHPKAVVFADELPRNALGKIRVDLVKIMARASDGGDSATPE
ncbi:AMP-binding protein [Stappia sp. F7233]|uniref:AMP-binding protein n=1 Tax=Stappia albiluteola TaxID=2758565 RepID=A0A839ABW6_9HYPH|nr:AMP-binding protein [Stappia albiluteola]MBA5777200.1 AMP-binding protein [Stappia albiluteola]